MRTLRDDLGTPVRVPQRPDRLVSLVPNLSETLWWWHLADRLVAVTDHCAAPPRAFDGAVRIRGTKNPDVAGIVALAPDLVVANEEENREHDVRRLREAGVAVYVTRVRTVVDAADALARLGEAVGAPAGGVALRHAILRALDRLRPPRAPLSTVCPIWRDSSDRADGAWWLTGRDTFAGDLLDRCGFDVTVAAPRDARYPRVPLTELAGRDPAVVLLPDEPYAFGPNDAEVFASWRARVRHLDGTALSWWGPRTPNALAELSASARQLARPRRRPGQAVAHSP